MIVATATAAGTILISNIAADAGMTITAEAVVGNPYFQTLTFPREHKAFLRKTNNT
jgi:hypothetical protein